MGCCGSKKQILKETRQPYSWENRENIDVSNYTIDGVIDGCVVKEQGSIDGQAFVVQNCKNSKIYLFDHIASITIDDCFNCQFVIGPTKGSIFFRDCQDCKSVVACQQFRTRDCSKMDTFLLCTTQPIIESSSKMKFGCFQLAYSDLEKQFEASMLSVFNNNWYNIHDFTPINDSKNWSLLSESVNVADVFDMSPVRQNNIEDNANGDSEAVQIKGLKLSASLESSVVPLTRGSREKNHLESCFVLIFSSENSKQVALKTIAILAGQAELVQTKEISLSPADIRRILLIEDSQIDFKSINEGPVIGLEFNGESCVEACGKARDELSAGGSTIYASPSSECASREIESFYNFCDMQMSV